MEERMSKDSSVEYCNLYIDCTYSVPKMALASLGANRGSESSSLHRQKHSLNLHIQSVKHFKSQLK